MKVLLDTNIKKEIIEYLLTQEGIEEVKINEIDLFEELEIKYNDKITPIIIMKYIDLFQNNKFSTMISFDKEIEKEHKTLKYVVDDMCCEYCYMGLVRELFDNKNVYAIKSNFDMKYPLYNVEFEIKYDINYLEEDLIKFIEENK